MKNYGKKTKRRGGYTTLKSGKTRLRVTVDIDDVMVRKSFTGENPTGCRSQFKAWLVSDSKEAPVERVTTVRQWAEHWLTTYKEPFIRWKVGKGYRMYVEKHILPAEIDRKPFGGLRLADVRPAHVAKLYALKKGLSKSAVNYIKIALDGMFETAIDSGLCDRNPVKKVSLPEAKKVEVHAFTKSQIQEIVAYLDHHECGPYVALLIYTGLRIGEMLALMWSDIDEQSQVIHVRRTLKQDEGGLVAGETTKTKRNRVVPYDDILKKHLGKIPRIGLFVVSKNFDYHHTPRSFDKLYYRFFDDLNAAIAERAEAGEAVLPIPRLSPHKCRHTFATYMLRSGADIRYVQELLGHSTIQTTEIYTDVNVDDLRSNIKKLVF